MHRAGEGVKIVRRPDWSTQLNWVRQAVPRRETSVWQEADAVAERLRARPINDAELQWALLFLRLDNLVAFARVYRAIAERAGQILERVPKPPACDASARRGTPGVCIIKIVCPVPGAL